MQEVLRQVLTALEYMRRYGAFEVRKKVGTQYAEPVPREEIP